jgi:hypothetical protein
VSEKLPMCASLKPLTRKKMVRVRGSGGTCSKLLEIGKKIRV